MPSDASRGLPMHPPSPNRNVAMRLCDAAPVFLTALVLFLFRAVILASDALEIDRGFGEFHFQSLEMLYEDLGNRKIAEPLVVGRNDEPGRSVGAAFPQGVLISLHVVIPELALQVVTFTDLPLLSRIVEPFFETNELLVLADVQKEFEDVRAAVGQLFFEVINVIVAPGPYLFRYQLVHSHDQNVL